MDAAQRTVSTHNYEVISGRVLSMPRKDRRQKSRLEVFHVKHVSTSISTDAKSLPVKTLSGQASQEKKHLRTPEQANKLGNTFHKCVLVTKQGYVSRET